MFDSFIQLQEAALSCTACPLSSTRTQVVFGAGEPDSEVMLIGEAPGANEDATGLSFVGRAGELLDKMLSIVGLTREKNVYITNVVKCRPPANRDPSPEEQEACIGILRNQVAIIRPKIIVCLGRVAAQRIIDKNFKVTKQHGEFILRAGVYLMGTYHPAALLRNPAAKPDAMGDFQALRDKIQEVCTRTYE